MCLGVQQTERARLKINAFYLRLSVSGTRKILPVSLTLCYLPRINGSPLEINGSRVPADSPGFLSLHRVVSDPVVFGSKDRVRLSEGARFEVYVDEERVLSGVFRKDEGNRTDNEWRMDLEREVVGMEAEVYVAVGGGEVMREKVEMTRRERRSKHYTCQLEEIPEEGEGGDDVEEVVDVEAVRWAVDVGIWVMCLGVGYLVSRRRRRILL